MRGCDLPEQMFVAEVWLVFFQLAFLNTRAEVIKLLRPFVSQFHHQEDNAAEDRDRHVNLVAGDCRIFSAAHARTTVTEEAISIAVLNVPTGTFNKPVRPGAGRGIETQKT